MRLPFSVAALGAALCLSAVQTSAHADTSIVDACSIANPPQNCNGLLASIVTQTVPTTANNVQGTPQPERPGPNGTTLPAECQVPLVGNLEPSNILGTAFRSIGDPSKWAKFGGDVVDLVQQSALHGINEVAGGDIVAALNRAFRNRQHSAVCFPMIVHIPDGVTVVGYRVEAANWERDPRKEVFKRCDDTVPGDCHIGWSALFTLPRPITASDGRGNITTGYYVMFANWSNDWGRVVKFTVFMRVPPGTTIVTSM